MQFTTDIAIETHLKLELGNLLAADSTASKSYSAQVWIYEELGDARAAARGSPPSNYVYRSDSQPMFSTGSSLETAGASIEARTLTADVAHKNGPFLGFVADTGEDPETTADYGTLAVIMLEPDDYMDFLKPDGTPLTSQVVTGADIVITAKDNETGYFGFGVGAGDGPNGEVAIEDDETTMDVDESNSGGVPTAFMVSRGPECGDNALDLENADGDDVDPNAEEDPVFSADAVKGTASVSGNGPHYFCVLTTDGDDYNEVAIPAIGDEDDMDAYEIEVTVKAGSTRGPDETDDGGAIVRNGTTLNLTYLSLHPAYNQRLVVVNRGKRDAEFWMDDFQTEDGTEIMNEIRGTVKAESRMVIRVQDELTVNMGGRTRASGTMNLTAPARRHRRHDDPGEPGHWSARHDDLPAHPVDRA